MMGESPLFVYMRVVIQKTLMTLLQETGRSGSPLGSMTSQLQVIDEVYITKHDFRTAVRAFMSNQTAADYHQGKMPLLHHSGYLLTSPVVPMVRELYSWVGLIASLPPELEQHLWIDEAFSSVTS